MFCVDIDHAERMRQRARQRECRPRPPRTAATSSGSRATATRAKRELDHFIDPESRYPVIATTSKMLTTGVDAQTCKLIVLDQPIGSMTEFKQIIGRGTRLREDYGKVSFTIMDFRKNTDKFADPEFDGEPVRVYVASAGREPRSARRRRGHGGEDPVGDGGGRRRRPRRPVGPRRREDDGPREVLRRRRARCGSSTSGSSTTAPVGKLITESLRDYTRGSVREHFASLDDFLTRWQRGRPEGRPSWTSWPSRGCCSPS